MRWFILVGILFGLAYLGIKTIHNDTITGEYCREKSEAQIEVKFQYGVKEKSASTQKELFATCMEEEKETSILESVQRTRSRDYLQESE